MFSVFVKIIASGSARSDFCGIIKTLTTKRKEKYDGR